MRRVSLLNVYKAALAVYLFCLVFGIYFTAKASVEGRVVQTGIVTLLLVDDQPEEQDSNSNKKFGFQFAGEEDDDDSAREFIFEPASNYQFDSRALHKSIVCFVSNPQNINTPPPWC
jgi:hypothetical protein